MEQPRFLTLELPANLNHGVARVAINPREISRIEESRAKTGTASNDNSAIVTIYLRNADSPASADRWYTLEHTTRDKILRDINGLYL